MVTDPIDPAEHDGRRRHGLEKHEVAPLSQGAGNRDNREAADPMTSWHSPMPTNGTRPSNGSQPSNGTKPTTPGPSGSSAEQPNTPNGPSFPVLPTSEHDMLAQRLRHAVSGFVDSPRGAVEEADALLGEVATRLADLLAERRGTLRAAWHENDAVISETEELRLAMRGYRNVLERLISV
ncbi:hypothetical protein ADL28_28605 [Streptomyces violaceusniger]|uniref:Uncharacterized protein n=3 Tax=Streptomyces TaxID=1883 RepID=A0ABD5JFU8_9ACTN|nr:MULTISPECIES: hypothetical protein [Streptomyces]MEE4586089.1 hypothetical protein [Streptomyces sp. DSM 41602]AJZ85474.1 hypothetical protein AS97_30595 [Streptomyces sp. AgN23]KUL48574.1 hypothetical protein ADL28_28605 [Streptomyces violaceusniger]RSS37467.1 hypothetical protein EF902_32770 [Streptomyces sp. WAC05858]WTA81335.1 hypothetical protein OG751_16310 [Streptomyces antimycoticus]